MAPLTVRWYSFTVVPQQRASIRLTCFAFIAGLKKYCGFHPGFSGPFCSLLRETSSIVVRTLHSLWGAPHGARALPSASPESESANNTGPWVWTFQYSELSDDCSPGPWLSCNLKRDLECSYTLIFSQIPGPQKL